MKFVQAGALVLAAQASNAFVAPMGSVVLRSSALGGTHYYRSRSVTRGMASTTALDAAAQENAAELMRKPQVVSEIMERAGLNKAQAEAALVAFTETVVDSVADGKKINLQGFGTFEPRSRKGRQGRNPRTGEPIEIMATTVPAFSASKSFKDQVKTNHAK